MKREYFDSFYIAGFNYYEGAIVFNELTIGTKLDLVSEKDNSYDKHAIALYYKEKKLGFIPAAQNTEMSKILNFGYNIFEAVIQQICPEAHPALQVKVIVYLTAD